MNIAIFSECYRPTRNGVVVSVDTFARGLRARGHRVDLFVPRFPGYPVAHPHVYRFPSIRVPHVPDSPVALPYWPQVYAAFDRLNADLVHAQSIFVMSRLGAYLARRNNLPLVATYHTLVAEYSHYVPLPSVATKALLVMLSRRFCNACQVVIVPTRSVGDVLRSYGVRSPLVPLATGIDVESFSGGDGTRVRERHHLPSSAKVLLFVGRIAREKNLDFLFQVTRHLLARDPDIRLLLVGPGPYLPLAAAYVRRLGLERHVVFAGSQPRSALKHYYAAADLFVFPSLTDTQGLVLVEAMAAGLPCIAAQATGACDVLEGGRYGLLCPAAERDFVAAVESLLVSPEKRAEYAQAGRQRARAFSREATVAKLEALYRDVIAEHRRSRWPEVFSSR